MKTRGCHNAFSRGWYELGHPHDQEVGRRDLGMKHWRNYVRRHYPTAKDFSISLRDVFALAEKQIPSIVVEHGLVGGNPCIKGTRIPVYMILDALEYHGSVKAVLKSYPQLTIDQVKDAVRFSKIALECCIGY